jgi:hypothetical protein
MGFPEVNNPEPASSQSSPVRARAVESLRTALQLAPSAGEPRVQPGNLNPSIGSPNKSPDIGLAMGLAREAITTAAKAAEDELRRLRELLENAEARASAAEERARAAEERARMADGQRADAELLLTDIRDRIVSKVAHRRAA